MIEALDQKACRADMTGIAWLGGRYVIDRFWCGTDTTTDGMTPGTSLGCVLEYGIHMALLTPQGGVYTA